MSKYCEIVHKHDTQNKNLFFYSQSIMAAISEQYEEQNTVDFPEMWITNLYTDSSFPLWSIPETKG